MERLLGDDGSSEGQLRLGQNQKLEQLMEDAMHESVPTSRQGQATLLGVSHLALEPLYQLSPLLLPPLAWP